jgi:hypothetical protein
MLKISDVSAGVTDAIISVYAEPKERTRLVRTQPAFFGFQSDASPLVTETKTKADPRGGVIDLPDRLQPQSTFDD